MSACDRSGIFPFLQWFSSFRILGGLVRFCSLEYIIEGFAIWNIREFRGFYSLQFGILEYNRVYRVLQFIEY